ncbi:MAG: hypothetical protein QM687_09285 [Ferruginibacter sp.]
MWPSRSNSGWKATADLVLAAQGLAQFGLDGFAVLQELVHRLLEDDGAVAAGCLGFVERDVGLAGELVRVGFVVLGRRDADRDADEGLAAEDVEGLVEGLDDALAEPHSGSTRPGACVWMMANSSPPRRASVSPEPSISPRRWPTAWIRSSPARWPRVSLTCLKRSRSSIEYGEPAVARRALRRGRGPASISNVRAIGQAGQLIVRSPVFGVGASGFESARLAPELLRQDGGDERRR